MHDIGAQFREYARLERKRAGAGLTLEELTRWTQLKRSLAKRFSPGISNAQADQRKSLRVPTRLKVSFHSRTDVVESMMTNLSRGGLFLVTEQLLDIGTRFTLRLEIEESGEVLELPVVVVCHNLGPSSVGKHGMGVRFGDMDSDVAKRMMDLYEQAIHKLAQETERDPRRPPKRR